MSDQVEDTPQEEEDASATQEAEREAGAPASRKKQREERRNGVINLLDRDWAIGIEWFVYDPSVVTANLTRIAGVHSPYIQRRQEPRNAGIASTSLGHSSRLASAAAALANWRPGSWLAAYPLGGGLYWIIAVLRNVIVEDTYALNEQEARALYKDMTTPDWGWELVAADSSWERSGLQLSEDALIAPSLESDLKAAVAMAEPEVLGQAIAWKLVFRKYAWTLIPIVLLVIALFFDVPDRATEYLAEEIEVIPPTEVYLSPSYTEAPRADVWLLHCARSLDPMAYFVPGWSLNRITCDAESDRVVYEYARETEGVARQLEVAWDDLTSDKELQISSQVSFVVTPLGYAEQGPKGLDPQYTSGELSSLYFDLALILDTVPTLASLVQEPEDRETAFNAAPNGGDLISITPSSSYTPVSMTSTDSPKRWYEAYGVAGMTINRVSYNGTNWTYEGRIYAKQ